MKIYQFEGAVWKQEGVRIVVQAPSGARFESYGSKPRIGTVARWQTS